MVLARTPTMRTARGHLARILRFLAFPMLAGVSGCADPGPDPRFDPVGGQCGTLEVAEPSAQIAPECVVPDAVCPDTPPVDGQACAVDGFCEYEDGYTFGCWDGRWGFDSGNSMTDVPPLAQTCLDPAETELAGGRVMVGPARGSEPFRSFADCDEADLVWGDQGGAMLPIRLHVEGVEAPPCVIVETRQSVGVLQGEWVGNRVALHCGESNLIYVVLGGLDLCDAPDQIVLALEVNVHGIGTTTARVRIANPASCGLEEG